MAELVKLILLVVSTQQDANNKNSFSLPYFRCQETLTSVRRLYKNNLTTILNSETHCEILALYKVTTVCVAFKTTTEAKNQRTSVSSRAADTSLSSPGNTDQGQLTSIHTDN
jgi:hypothetical protein